MFLLPGDVPLARASGDRGRIATMASKLTVQLHDSTATCGLLSADVRDAQGFTLYAVNAWVNLVEPGFPVDFRVQGEIGAPVRIAGPHHECRDDAFAWLATLGPTLKAMAQAQAKRIRAARRDVEAAARKAYGPGIVVQDFGSKHVFRT
jgi:hypothetical protein